ncbi:MAG: helix-turn-helix domain-containing protein [Bacteroidota bacterium]
MKDQTEYFVERGTLYKMEHATLSVYETNCPCKGVEFTFHRHMLTLMLSGHKTIYFNDNRFEFFPGTLYIPTKDTLQVIDIPNASLTNPTKCLVLDIQPSFLQTFTHEIIDREENDWFVDQLTVLDRPTHFLSNDEPTIACFKRLYEYQLQITSRPDELIAEMVLKELVLRIFKTKGRIYLLNNFNNQIDENIQKNILYIRANLSKQLSIGELAHQSGFGKTNYFHKFKEATGMTPVNFILKERIEYAKKLISPHSSLQSIAFQSGFNSYEHFCKSFKKFEQLTPLKYKQSKAERSLEAHVG